MNPKEWAHWISTARLDLMAAQASWIHRHGHRNANYDESYRRLGLIRDELDKMDSPK